MDEPLFRVEAFATASPFSAEATVTLRGPVAEVARLCPIGAVVRIVPHHCEIREVAEVLPDRVAPEGVEPPDDAWITGPDGHQWATDSTLVIRRDAPRPSSMQGPGHIHAWLFEPPELAPLLERVRDGSGCSTTAWFAARMRPILEAGIVCTSSAMRGLHVVRRNDEIVALVMTLRNGSRRTDDVLVVDGHVVAGVITFGREQPG